MIKKSIENRKNSIFHKDDFDGKDVFEIGSGHGGFTFEYLVDANSVFGIDTNLEAIEYLTNNWPGAQEIGQVLFQEGNIVEISLDGKEFDMVVFSNSF